MPYFFFFWNEINEEHLAEHGVTPEEFEQVLLGEHWFMKSDSSGRPAVAGFTDEGRELFCVYEHIDDMTIIPVTAYDR